MKEYYISNNQKDLLKRYGDVLHEIIKESERDEEFDLLTEDLDLFHRPLDDVLNQLITIVSSEQDTFYYHKDWLYKGKDNIIQEY